MNRHQRRAAITRDQPGDRDRVFRSYWRALMDDLPTDARHEFRLALAGDETAAMYAVARAPGPLLGRVCLALHMAHASPAAMRYILGFAWSPSGRVLREVAATRTNVNAMFRSAQFMVPDEMPDPVTIWRGAVGITPAVCTAGLSWTTYRCRAVLWAVRLSSIKAARGQSQCAPIVVRRTVPRSAIIGYFHRDASDTRMDEIIHDAPSSGEVDGDLSEWASTAATLAAMDVHRLQTKALDGFEGGPSLPAWGAEAWASDQAEIIESLRLDALACAEGRATGALAHQEDEMRHARRALAWAALGASKPSRAPG